MCAPYITSHSRYIFIICQWDDHYSRYYINEKIQLVRLENKKQIKQNQYDLWHTPIPSMLYRAKLIMCVYCRSKYIIFYKPKRLTFWNIQKT